MGLSLKSQAAMERLETAKQRRATCKNSKKRKPGKTWLIEFDFRDYPMLLLPVLFAAIFWVAVLVVLASTATFGLICISLITRFTGMLRFEASAVLPWVANVTLLLLPIIVAVWAFACVMVLDCVVTATWLPSPAAASLPSLPSLASLCSLGSAAFTVTTVTAQHLVTTQVVTTGQHVTTGHGQQQTAAVVQLVHCALVVVALVVVVAAQVAADTTPVAENAATRASTNREMAIFFMIHLLYFAQVGLSLLICAVVKRFLRIKTF